MLWLLRWYLWLKARFLLWLRYSIRVQGWEEIPKLKKPVLILPNQKLQQMEDTVKSVNRDLAFRITGMVTEYRGRNYILLEKVLIPTESAAQF